MFGEPILTAFTDRNEMWHMKSNLQCAHYAKFHRKWYITSPLMGENT